MAINTLKGSNWDTDADWSVAGTKPASGGNVALTETLPTQGVTAGLDQGSVLLKSLQVRPSCTGPVGSDSGPLIGSTELLKIEGQKGFFYECSLNAAAGTVPDCRIKTTDSSVIVQLGSETNDAGTWNKIRIARGKLTIAAGLVFGGSALLDVGFVDTPAGDVTVAIPTNSGTLPELRQTGGVVTSRIATTLANILGGTLWVFDKLVTSLNIHSGAKVIYNHTALTTVTVYPGGVLDLANEFRELTITNLFHWPGSIIIGDKQQPDGSNDPIEGTVIVTNDHPLFGGGRWVPPGTTA